MSVFLERAFVTIYKASCAMIYPFPNLFSTVNHVLYRVRVVDDREFVWVSVCNTMDATHVAHVARRVINQSLFRYAFSRLCFCSASFFYAIARR